MVGDYYFLWVIKRTKHTFIINIKLLQLNFIMKNKISLLLFVIIITQSQLVAQYNLISGHIITNGQDTVKGYLRNDTDAKLSKSIEFHNDMSEEEYTIYTPSQISGFGFCSGRSFKSLQQENDTASKFGKIIVTGKINMYLVRKNGSDNKKIFLFRSDTSLSVTLKDPVNKIIKKKGKTYSLKDRKYINLLSYITDSHKMEKSLNSVKYQKKDIAKYVMIYNSQFEKEYPSNIYKDNSRTTIDIAVGIPIKILDGYTQFRISAFANKTNIERSFNFSYRMGISYRYWHSNNQPKEITHQNSDNNYRWQHLSIIPLGFSIEGNPRKIIPYGYAGFGIGLIFMSDYIIRDYEITGTLNHFAISPTFNCGLGVKFKVKSNYIITEITPTWGNGLFLNLGYSF